jgi:hypothetical protein
MRTIRHPVVWTFVALGLLVGVAALVVVEVGYEAPAGSAMRPTTIVGGTRYFYENYTIPLHLGPIPVNCSENPVPFAGNVTFESIQFLFLEIENCSVFQNISVLGIEPSGIEFSHLFVALPVYGQEANWTSPDRVFGVQLYVTGVYGPVEPRVLVST